MLECIVCGRRVRRARFTIDGSEGGVVICRPRCARLFQANPARFVPDSNELGGSG